MAAFQCRQSCGSAWGCSNAKLQTPHIFCNFTCFCPQAAGDKHGVTVLCVGCDLSSAGVWLALSISCEYQQLLLWHLLAWHGWPGVAALGGAAPGLGWAGGCSPAGKCQGWWLVHWALPAPHPKEQCSSPWAPAHQWKTSLHQQHHSVVWGLCQDHSGSGWAALARAGC